MHIHKDQYDSKITFPVHKPHSFAPPTLVLTLAEMKGSPIKVSNFSLRNLSGGMLLKRGLINGLSIGNTN